MKKIVPLILIMMLVFNTGAVFSFGASTPLQKGDEAKSFLSGWNETSESKIISRGNEIYVKGNSYSYKYSIPKDFEKACEKVASKGILEYESRKTDAEFFVVTPSSALEDLMNIEGSEIITAYVSNEATADTIEYVFDLPKGYELAVDRFSEDIAYVKNEKGEDISVIEAATAVDATGTTLETKFAVENNILVQSFSADEVKYFPVVVAAVNHPNIEVTQYYTKSEVKQLLNHCTSMEIDPFWELIINLGVTAVGGKILGGSWALITYNRDTYYANEKALWQEALDGFTEQKKFAKIVMPYKWHKGQRSYYPFGTPEISNVEAIGD